MCSIPPGLFSVIMICPCFVVLFFVLNVISPPPDIYDCSVSSCLVFQQNVSNDNLHSSTVYISGNGPSVGDENWIVSYCFQLYRFNSTFRYLCNRG